MNDLSNQKSVARKAIKEAGKELKTRFNKLGLPQISKKSKHEIVTPADYAAEEIIIDAIKANFPHHNILSEEAGEVEGQEEDFLWVVDPLDGTTNFSIHNPFFAVSIGVFFKQHPVLAFVYAPMIDELYEAEKGKGATLNGKKIRVSEQDKVGDSRLAFCHGHRKWHLTRTTKIFSKLKLASRTLRQFGSASLETAFVACGRLEALMIPGVNVWDIAAGVLLVREAGGKVTDFEGKPWNLDSADILASNGKIHQEVLKYLEQ